MENYQQQAVYTIDEIRTKYSYGLPDWECTADEPIIGEHITWAQWYEAFPRPTKPSLELLSPFEHETTSLECVPDHDTTVWMPNILDPHTLPAAAYLDPDGWNQIMQLKSRNYKHWQKFCPNTYAVATALFDGLVQHDLWGYHRGKKQWVTVTAGFRPEDKKKKARPEATRQSDLEQEDGELKQNLKQNPKRVRYWADKQVKLINVLNALGNPDKFALGSTDARLNVYECNEIWRHPFYVTRVRRLQIDVDMDRAWGGYGIFDQDSVERSPPRSAARLR